MLIEFSEMRGSKVCLVFRGLKSENYAITIKKKCMVFASEIQIRSIFGKKRNIKKHAFSLMVTKLHDINYISN